MYILKILEVFTWIGTLNYRLFVVVDMVQWDLLHPSDEKAIISTLNGTKKLNISTYSIYINFVFHLYEFINVHLYHP